MKLFSFIFTTFLALGLFATTPNLDDPFSLISMATNKAAQKMDEPRLLSMSSMETKKENSSCGNLAWRFVFTDHSARTTMFVKIFGLYNDECVLKTTSELSERYPWVGVAELESKIDDMQHSYADAKGAVESLWGDLKNISVEIYCPLHYRYINNIYARFTKHLESGTQTALYNFMSGKLE